MAPRQKWDGRRVQRVKLLIQPKSGKGSQGKEKKRGRDRKEERRLRRRKRRGRGATVGRNIPFQVKSPGSPLLTRFLS